MVWDTCNIVLHSASNSIFYTNDIVTGSVILEIKQDLKVEQIDFIVKGTSKAMWSRPSPTIPYIKIYSEKKELLRIIVDVFDGIKGTIIKPGIITRQFHFYLPPNLPSTFKDSVAKIHYRIKVKSKNAYRRTKKAICPIIVVNHLNLNHLDEYKIPMFYEATKQFGESGSFSLMFKTFKGFTCRQLIPFEAIITNEKNAKVKKIEVSLIQDILYNVSFGFYNTEKVLCKTVYRDVLSIATQCCYFHMEIPDSLPATTDDTDFMVNISYLLRVEVSFWFHLPLQVDIPVKIATIPIDYSSSS